MISRVSQLPMDTIDRAGQIGHSFQWIVTFRIGRFMGKRPALPLDEPVVLVDRFTWKNPRRGPGAASRSRRAEAGVPD